MEKHSNLEMTQQQVIQQEKLASIGQLAAGVAHEINNPLGFISSNVESARVYLDEFKEMIDLYKKTIEHIEKNPLGNFTNEIIHVKETELSKNIDFMSSDLELMFDDIEDGLERITEIVSSLRTFSRQDSSDEFTEYNLNKSIKNALIITRNDVKYTASVEENLSDIPNIRANGNKIDQAILNIILNASASIKEKQSLENPKEEGIIRITTEANNEYVRCIIEDNGIGIEEENINRIFDPFYTSKPVGEGTGLGLSIAHEIIVTEHKGQLYATSKPMVGTKFVIILPVE